MFELRRLETVDFGPFKGEQQIVFPEEGVTVVYGENMRGKTLLLNAFRYALFGQVRSRGAHTLSLHQIGNWESASSGQLGFRVVLHFASEGHEYELTRICRPREGIREPRTDADYVEERFLSRDGSLCGPTEADTELAGLMPEQVSRFFLFDGELLQEYEELLRDDSDMGRGIRDAIERILGLPVLTNARYDCSFLYDEAQKIESKTAQRDQRTQELGNLLESQTVLRARHEEEVVRLEGLLRDMRGRKSALEDELRRNERASSLLDERARLEEEVTELDAQLEKREERLRDVMAGAWRGLIDKTIRSRRAAKEQELSSLQARVTEQKVRVAIHAQIETALAGNECPTCDRVLDIETREHLRTKLLFAPVPDADTQADEESLRKVGRLVAELRDLESSDALGLAIEIEDQIQNLVVSKANREFKLHEVTEQLASLDEKAITRLKGDYDELVSEMTVTEQGLKEERKALDQLNLDIERLQRELDRQGGADLAKDRRRRELFGNLRDLFDRGVGIYRDELRAKVEAAASGLFVNLTTEPEYARLEINQNYGLTIIHRDGEPIPVRSAGAEHVVALSLIGALQQSAPLQGPVIMDSPFGRLDRQHKSRIVRSLPGFTKQVVLLVYEDELPAELARSNLAGSLRAEYQLVHRSARHTDIEPR